MLQRDFIPRINVRNPLAAELTFAGVLGAASTLKCVDYSIYGNSGTLTNMEPGEDWEWDTTLNRWVLKSDGSNEYIATSIKYANVVSTTAMTIMAWAYPTGSPTNGNHCYMGQQIIQQAESTVYVGFGRANCALGSPTGDLFGVMRFTSTVVEARTAYATDAWNCLCGRHDGVTLAMYRDGVLAQSVSCGTAATFDKTVRIASGNASGYWLGKMADVLIWKRPLCVSEIQNLADPSNTMLSDLLLPPRRKVWPVVASTASTYSPWLHGLNGGLPVYNGGLS